jgi:pilus assembly protein FimV
MAYRRFISLLFCSLLTSAGAAELGDARVSSYKGQPLVADIELSSLDDPAGAVQVRVANPDVYRGASIGVPAILSALTLSVVRQGGKQFVHVTSSRPVDTDMLHLFLELGQGSGRDVRLASLQLLPDPRPVPPPAPVPVPVPVAPPVPVAAAPAPAPLPVPHVVMPAPLHLAPVSTALPASVRTPAPTSCKASAPNNACVVLDTRNVALQAKLVGLEDKVKQLEAALAPAAEAHAEPPPIAAVKPPPAPVAVIVTPKKPKPVAPPPSATPWLWIGVAAVIALAALGAIVFLLLRRRKGAPAAPAIPKPGIMASVKNRLTRNKVAVET